MQRTHLHDEDQQVAAVLDHEIRRQSEGMELIPSENYVSQAVLEALGSEFTNKYSEGYPGKRYYGGQEFTDDVENLAIERAKQLFHCDHANVQPLSGAPANVATYFAWLEPGDTVLGMDLGHGGHLTHGHPVTYISKIFNFVRYKIGNLETGEIDYDNLRAMALEHKPKIILAGFSAYPRSYDYDKFAEIAKEVGAVAMADMAHIAGLIAGGVLPNPFDHGFHIITTTTHKTLRGPRGGMILSQGKVGNPLKKPEKTIENLPTLIDRSVFPGFQGGPHMSNTAAKAVAFGEALKPEFKVYAQQVLDNAKALADELMKLGCKLVTNGTDNHLMLIDTVTSWGLTGDVVETVLDRVNMTLNKNGIPDDKNPPYTPSGVRLGTPAMTTRGMKEDEMRKIAQYIRKAVDHRDDEGTLKNLQQEVKEFCLQYPVPESHG
ncbi:MAG: serine hydroxymethyltransferase [Candidatus Gracilibacteria bacterium]|nr:serine hydroxymethyltransferase [Candidatus Gracilibacteria bacterium]